MNRRSFMGRALAALGVAALPLPAVADTTLELGPDRMIYPSSTNALFYGDDALEPTEFIGGRKLLDSFGRA